jgi:putative redox protein
MTTTITADLTTGAVVELRNGRHVWTADEPLELNGTDTGPNPYELLLGALGACTCITISYYCQRKGWSLDSVSAKYSYDKIHADDCAHCDDEAQGFLHNVTAQIFMDGDLDDAQRARLTEIAQKCPVHRTLEAGLVFDETVIF